MKRFCATVLFIAIVLAGGWFILWENSISETVKRWAGLEEFGKSWDNESKTPFERYGFFTSWIDEQQKLAGKLKDLLEHKPFKIPLTDDEKTLYRKSCEFIAGKQVLKDAVDGGLRNYFGDVKEKMKRETKEQPQSPANRAAPTPAIARRAGFDVHVTQPLTIKITYGELKVGPGTTAFVIAEKDADNLAIRIGGQEAVIPKSVTDWSPRP